MSRSRCAVDARPRLPAGVAEPGALAQALVRHARESGYAKTLYALPGDERAGWGGPGQGRTWWVVPGRLPPLDQYGKIIVTSQYGGTLPKGRGAVVFVGLCMQKAAGLEPGESPPAARPGRARAMGDQPRWLWEDFLTEMAAGYIDPLAAKAEEAGGRPLTAMLEARDPGEANGRDSIAYDWSRRQLVARLPPHRRVRGHLGDLASAGTLAALAQRLRHAPRWRSLGVELAIGFQLWPDRVWPDRPDPGAAAWDVSRIWEAACRPWSLWLR